MKAKFNAQKRIFLNSAKFSTLSSLLDCYIMKIAMCSPYIFSPTEGGTLQPYKILNFTQPLEKFVKLVGKIL
jgi:hypothetical protein